MHLHVVLLYLLDRRTNRLFERWSLNMIGLEYITKEFRIGYRELARQLGISNQTVQDWVKKRRNIPVKRLEQLSLIFNLPTDYFQKELSSIEKGEVTISYLKSISENIEVPIIEEDSEILISYSSSSYEDQIRFLEDTLDAKKREKKIKSEITMLLENDSLLDKNEGIENISPFHNDSSNAKAIQNTVEILKTEKLANYFKVVAFLTRDLGLGGKPETTVSDEYKDFAKEYMQLLEKYKIK